MDYEIIKTVLNDDIVKNIPIIYVMKVILAIMKVEEQYAKDHM